MTTTDIYRKEGVLLSDRDERAQRAVKAFRALQPALSAYARVLTKRSNVRVEMSARDNGSTDGTKIFFRPPIALGDKTEHDRRKCDKRDEKLQLICPACLIREDVLTTIYHEIAHICFDSFAETTETDRVEALKAAIAEHGSKYSKKLEYRISMAPPHVKKSYIGLSSLVSQYLPLLVNCLEDARVNAELFKARKGTKQMFDANTWRTFEHGVEQRDPYGEITVIKWVDYPLNMQIMLGVFCKISGYDYKNWFVPEVVEALADRELATILSKMHTIRTAKGTYELAFPVLARLRELGFCKLPDDPDTPEPEESDDSGTDEDASSDASDDSSAVEGGTPDDSGSSDSDSEGSEAGEPGDSSDEVQPEGSGDGGGDLEEDRDAEADGDEDVSSEADASAGGDDTDDPGAGNEDGSGEASDVDADATDAGAEPAGDAGGESAGSSELEGSDDGRGSESDEEAVDSDRLDSDDASSESGDAEPSRGSSTGASAADEAESDDGEPVDDSSGSSSGSGDSSDGSDSDGHEVGRPQPEDDVAGDPAQDDLGPEGDSDGLVADDEADDDSASPVDEGDDDEIIDTGADKGEGGVTVRGEPNYGTPEDVEMGLKKWGQHDEKPHSAEVAADDHAVEVAIMQGFYFETPSSRILGVREHYFDKPIEIKGMNLSRGWDDDMRRSMGYSRRQLGADGDFHAPESILGPALLRMRVAFSDNARGKDIYHMKSGKINGKVLGKRAHLGDERLFRKKIMPGKRDYFVILGLDISGSTVGRNIALIKAAALAQAELLNRMGIKFAIYAHSGNVSSMVLEDGGSMYSFAGSALDLDIYHIKDADEPWDTKVQERLTKLGPDSANLDGHSLEYYRKRADERPETDKVILYYSDGKMPAENFEEELEILQREIRICRQNKYTLLGVGIRTDSPRQHGLDTVQVDSLEEIGLVVKHLEKVLK